MYITDSQDVYPPRDGISRWPDRLYDNDGKNVKIAVVPRGSLDPTQRLHHRRALAMELRIMSLMRQVRSFFINGFNDFFLTNRVCGE